MKKNAIVIGASKGVGFAIACRLAADGMGVTIASTGAENLERASQTAKEMQLDFDTEVVDATDETSVKALFNRLKQKGKLDLCVNCVGKNLAQTLVRKTKDGEIFGHSLEDWDRTIQINLNSVFLCGREEALSMIEQDCKGVIINIVTSLRNGAYGQSAYMAAKAGVTSLTKTWSLELAKYGIRCIAVAPGAIEGEALKIACERSEGHRAYMEKLREQIPLKRFAYESEVADAVSFAAGNEYITGTVLELDGGGLPPKVVFK